MIEKIVVSIAVAVITAFAKEIIRGILNGKTTIVVIELSADDFFINANDNSRPKMVQS